MKNPFKILHYNFYNQLCGFGTLKNSYYIICQKENEEAVPYSVTIPQSETESQLSSDLTKLSEQQVTAIKKLDKILIQKEIVLTNVQILTSPHKQTKRAAKYLQYLLEISPPRIQSDLQEPSLSHLEKTIAYSQHAHIEANMESVLILTKDLTSLICHLEEQEQKTIILVVHPQIATILLNAFEGKMPDKKCDFDYAAPYLLELNPVIANAYSAKANQEIIQRYKSPKEAKERCFSLSTDLCLTFKDNNTPTTTNLVITTPRGAKYQYISLAGNGATNQASLYQADNRTRAFVVLSNHAKMNIESLKRKYKFFKTCYEPKSVEVALTNNTYYLAVPYFKGVTLQSLINQGIMNPSIIMEFCYQIAKAMNACHEKGWIVLDSSPGNIICDIDETSQNLNACYIIDGGFSFQVNEPVPYLDLPDPKQASITPIPPECLNRPDGHYDLQASYNNA